MSNTNTAYEMPVVFECQGQEMIGMIHHADPGASVGVLVVVGGPQYRIGSHRQFILLARHLAVEGIPAMRFDVRGMGDADGEFRSFYEIEQDIRSAIECFLVSCPSLTSVVLWGLCDGASAALFYAYQDKRIKGLILLNPWVFTEQGSAKTYLKNYYLQRLLNKDFWSKIFSFKFDYIGSAISLWRMLKQAIGNNEVPQTIDTVTRIDDNLSLPIKMRDCLRQFSYPVLLILSGRDLVADEFRNTVADNAEWQQLLMAPHITRYDFAEADHTFSSAQLRERVAQQSVLFIKSLPV